MTTLSTPFHLHTSPSLSLHISCSSSFKPKISISSSSTSKPLFTSTKTPPARDRVMDFGKYKGKMLGTLPSSYLKWVSKNLRARDFEDWAKLADQVLDDAVYRDRIEWELAENVLNGNSARNVGVGGVSVLLEMSERFGWDNDDKIGWSKVNFDLLGTSKGGRIPRLGENGGGGERDVKREKKKVEEVLGGGGERRRERRVRLRMKREEDEGSEEEEEKLGILEKSGGNFGNGIGLEINKESEEDWMVGNSNRFPGREALLKKAYSLRMKRFS